VPPLSATAARGDRLIPDWLLSCLKLPEAGNDAVLERVDGAFRSLNNGTIFPDRDGIPSLLAGIDGPTDDITGRVKAFYEEHPFPTYEGIQEFGELVNRGQKTRFSRELLDAIGCNKLILECGCGTGQMSHFLSLNNNHVLESICLCRV
jgi:hypothetical protein